jgi:hypothetical protein
MRRKKEFPGDEEKENRYRCVELLAALGESVGESGGHSWRKRMEEC